MINEQIAEIYERNVDSLYRVCFMYMKNKADTEDMTQNTFLKLAAYLQKGETFSSREHETAWLMRVAINMCKTSLKSLWNRRVQLNDCDMTNHFHSTIPEPDETLEKLMKLPGHLKTALYLHYYEDYSTVEIAKMMSKPESTVRGYLHRGRKVLKKEIEADQSAMEGEIYNEI